ncbi:MAG: hypothetical protein HKN23_06470 [Verrucomicrobiales bacterium]|nr:hypothetical protein [Verrucomicrobiales bacterium]
MVPYLSIFRAFRIFALAIFLPVVTGLVVFAQEIPEDLLEDEHVREEFGVNDFTTPSIRKIFEDLNSLRPLPYDQLKRKVPETTPKDRSKLALALGGLIADGFLAVEAEKLLDLEPVGRALLKHAKVLGAGTRLSEHTNSILEHGALGDWSGLKTELAKTQKDVEKEMVLIRDVDAAHLISLGGWLRALEIGCAASLDPFDAKKAGVLARADVAEYFVESIKTLEDRVQDKEHMKRIATGLEEIYTMLDVPESKAFTEAEVKTLMAKVQEMNGIALEPAKKSVAATPPKSDKGPATPDLTSETPKTVPADQ